jgi:predicted NAD/FAD-binding protein
MRIAIIGTGVSGLTCAHLLHGEHDLVLYEAGEHVGGHVNTVEVEEQDGRRLPVDTGFIVFNRETYPGLCRLFEKLGVESQDSSMTFSVKDQRSGLEWSSQSLSTVYAQRSNLLDPAFHRMVAEILRFNREAPRLLDSGDDALTVGQYLEEQGYSRAFIEHYLVPLAASVWSADPQRLSRFPARMLVRFFHNHRFLQLLDQPVWRTVKGGSRTYVERLVAPFRDRIRLRSPVESVRRDRAGVEVRARGQEPERFDKVIVAAHADQALAMLADPTGPEREILGALPYQENEAVLHTDASVLPQKRCWSAWNYLVPREPHERVAVTYCMNVLQRLPTETTWLVSLNMGGEIDPARVARRIRYQHPVFTAGGLAAQRRHGELCGPNHTFFCGAYWRYGFHEDGLQSALAVCSHFGKAL